MVIIPSDANVKKKEVFIMQKQSSVPSKLTTYTLKEISIKMLDRSTGVPPLNHLNYNRKLFVTLFYFEYFILPQLVVSVVNFLSFSRFTK